MILFGGLLLVGQEHHNNDRGAVLAYYLSSTSGTWELTQSLVSADGSEGDQFGASVSIDVVDTHTIAVGAPLHDGIGTTAQDSGAVYVYSRRGSAQVGQFEFRARLTASDAASEVCEITITNT